MPVAGRRVVHRVAEAVEHRAPAVGVLAAAEPHTAAEVAAGSAVAAEVAAPTEVVAAVEVADTTELLCQPSDW